MPIRADPAKTGTDLLLKQHQHLSEPGFSAKVRILETQLRRAVEINTQIEGSNSPEQKTRLKAELDEVMARLDENNKKMVSSQYKSQSRNCKSRYSYHSQLHDILQKRLLRATSPN